MSKFIVYQEVGCNDLNFSTSSAFLKLTIWILLIQFVIRDWQFHFILRQSSSMFLFFVDIKLLLDRYLHVHVNEFSRETSSASICVCSGSFLLDVGRVMMFVLFYVIFKGILTSIFLCQYKSHDNLNWVLLESYSPSTN